MLNKDYMELKATSSCCDMLELFNAGNGQSIREELLRQAVNYCDNYATDILILLQGDTIKELFEGKFTEIDIYFRQNGVDWQCDNGYTCLSVPKLYRSCAKLVKERAKVQLYKGYGNC